MAETEIHPQCCLLDDIASVLLTQCARESSRDVCETDHETSILGGSMAHVCVCASIHPSILLITDLL